VRKISVKISDTGYHKLLSAKGEKTMSEYVRELISGANKHATEEARKVDVLLTDIAFLRDRLMPLLARQTEGAKGEHLIALAAYLTDAIRALNPPAFANQQDKVRAAFDSLKKRITGDEHVKA